MGLCRCVVLVLLSEYGRRSFSFMIVAATGSIRIARKSWCDCTIIYASCIDRMKNLE